VNVEARPALAGWPVNLLVAGRRVLVVGAGRVAARKVGTLLDLGADVVVVAPTVGPEVAEWRAGGRLQVRERAFVADDLDDAWLAVTATGRPDVDGSVQAAGEARRVFVNAADDPQRCTFTLMSVLRRADLVVAIGTGGRSPALARWLRARAADDLGPEYEVLLDLLASARDEMRAAGRSTEEADWQRALDSGIVDLVRDGRIGEAKELLRSCL